MDILADPGRDVEDVQCPPRVVIHSCFRAPLMVTISESGSDPGVALGAEALPLQIREIHKCASYHKNINFSPVLLCKLALW